MIDPSATPIPPGIKAKNPKMEEKEKINNDNVIALIKTKSVNCFRIRKSENPSKNQAIIASMIPFEKILIFKSFCEFLKKSRA